jgi:hypothetical protein
MDAGRSPDTLLSLFTNSQDDGVFLACCGNTEETCADHPNCANLTGACCPTENNVYLACCEMDWAFANAHPDCDNDSGQVCPFLNGTFAECCL